MELQWPAGPLPNSTYYIALYFADDQVSSSGQTFDISINHVPYIRDMNVTSSGVAAFATQWPLSGLTRIRFTPTAGSNSSTLINGGEIFNVLALGKRTLVRDGTSLKSYVLLCFIILLILDSILRTSCCLICF